MFQVKQNDVARVKRANFPNTDSFRNLRWFFITTRSIPLFCYEITSIVNQTLLHPSSRICTTAKRCFLLYMYTISSSVRVLFYIGIGMFCIGWSVVIRYSVFWEHAISSPYIHCGNDWRLYWPEHTYCTILDLNIVQIVLMTSNKTIDKTGFCECYVSSTWHFSFIIL